MSDRLNRSKRSRKPLPAAPATSKEREQARIAAAALRRAIDEPTSAGEPQLMFVDFARPRQGALVKTWNNLPGLFCSVRSKIFTHTLLPGWEYTVREMRTELIEDLDRLAATGERPAVATR